MTADPLSLTISCVSLALSQIALIEKVFGWTPRVRRAAQPVVKDGDAIRVPWHRIRPDKFDGRLVIPGWGIAGMDEADWNEGKRKYQGWVIENTTPMSSAETKWAPIEVFPR